MDVLTREEQASPTAAKLQLFRPDANFRQAPQLYGDIVLIRPLSLMILLWAVLLFFLLAACLLAFGHYTSKTHVTGILLPDRGILRVFPVQAGTLVECRARNGQQVHRGDVLFLLTSDRSTARVRSVSGETHHQFLARRQSLLNERALSALLSTQQAADLRDHLRKLDQQQTALASEITTTRAQLRIDEEAVEKYRLLHKENLLSVLDLREKERAPLEHQKMLAELRRSQISLEQERESLQSQLERLPLQLRVQSAPLERAISELDGQLNESDANHRAVVRAPADGTLASVLDHIGMSVQPDTALAALVPAGAKLQAYLYAPSSSVGFIKAGQTALLRYRAYPSERFGQQSASLTGISQVAISPVEYAQRTGVAAQEPMYEMIAQLPSRSLTFLGQSHELWPGMELEADILLERGRLGDWFLQPILAAKGRLTQ